MQKIAVNTKRQLPINNTLLPRHKLHTEMLERPAPHLSPKRQRVNRHDRF
jgi:hypothetical protein